jgi:hypothetical protein
MSAIARLEDKLAAELIIAAGAVSRADCFDHEQRAELYAILEALKADTQAHRTVVGKWVNDRTGEVTNV